MNTLDSPPFARITFNPHSTFSSINPRASFEFKIFPQQAVDSRRGMSGMESNERRDARLRGGIDHFTRYPTGSSFTVSPIRNCLAIMKHSRETCSSKFQGARVTKVLG